MYLAKVFMLQRGQLVGWPIFWRWCYRWWSKKKRKMRMEKKKLWEKRIYKLRWDWGFLWFFSFQNNDVDFRSLGGDDLCSFIISSQVEGDGFRFINSVCWGGSLDLNFVTVDNFNWSNGFAEFDSSSDYFVDRDRSKFFCSNFDDAILEIVKVDNLGSFNLVEFDFFVSFVVFNIPIRKKKG